MRKPHKHARPNGELFDCTDSECRMPFRVAAVKSSKPRRDQYRDRVANREEQHARYLDCGPLAWDDKD